MPMQGAEPHAQDAQCRRNPYGIEDDDSDEEEDDNALHESKHHPPIFNRTPQRMT